MENEIISVSQQIALPPMLIYVGVIGGILVSVIEIVRFLLYLLARPLLEVRLTKEVFFRLIDLGECVFANVILLAKNGDIEVKDTLFTLKKLSGNKKEYLLNTAHIGRKIDTPSNTIASHSFYTTSSTTYVTEKSVERQVHVAVLSEYEGRIKESLLNFQNKVSNYRESLWDTLDTIGSDSGATEKVLRWVNSLASECSNEIMTNVQLEDGDYELLVKVGYKPLGRLSVFIGTNYIRSSITFSVKNFKSSYRVSLENYLRTIAINIVFAKNDQLLHPEYQPLDSTEIT